MAFELRVTFSGLCLFLIRDDCKQVAVVLPDCRLGGRLKPVHPDGEPVVHHAGFLRFDLANLSPGATAKTLLELQPPLREGVHHFRNEQLTFGIRDPAEAMTLETELAAMERIAPKGEEAGETGKEDVSDCQNEGESRLELVTLFDVNAPLAMRTILTAGSLKKKRGSTEWVFHADALNPAGSSYEGEFATQVIWKHTITDCDHLDLTIAPFAETTGKTLRLFPTTIVPDDPTIQPNQVLLLTIGNLCPHNPLEWGEYPEPPATKEDRDFKWFYQLFRDAQGNPITGMVPYPIRKGGGAGVDTCAGLRMNVQGFV